MTITASYQPVANAAARDSLFPHPTRGQSVFQIDTGEVLFWYGANGWRPAWNSPWGSQAYAEITTASAVIALLPNTIPVAGLSVTFNPLAGREYVAEFDGGLVSNANGDFIAVYIDMDDPALIGCGTANYHYASESKAITLTGSAPDVLRFSKRFTSTRPSLIVNISAGQIIGTLGQIYANACGVSSIKVTDIGPSGPPTY